MKTATINIYHAYGTKCTTVAEVHYRGKRLMHWYASETPQTMLDNARRWAHEHEFTHTRVTYG